MSTPALADQLPAATATDGPPVGNHAIVIGGGAAGLRRAAELAHRFRHVTIVERERLTTTGHCPGDPTAAYLRARGLPIERVRLLQGCEVIGLLAEAAGRRVVGVQLRLQPGPGVGTPIDPWRELQADHVVDTRRTTH